MISGIIEAWSDIENYWSFKYAFFFSTENLSAILFYVLSFAMGVIRLCEPYVLSTFKKEMKIFCKRINCRKIS